jgi:hypothetical protein
MGIPPLDSPLDKKSSDRPLRFFCFTLLRLNFVKLMNGLVRQYNDNDFWVDDLF